MACIIKGNEYKKLLQMSRVDEFTLDAAIAQWQTEMKTDTFPRAKWVRDIFMKRYQPQTNVGQQQPQGLEPLNIQTVDPSTLKDDSKAFVEYFDKVDTSIAYDSKTHTYAAYNATTGEFIKYLTPVTKVLQMNGYGEAFSQEDQEKYALHSIAGTGIHAAFQNAVFKKYGIGEEASPDDLFNMTPLAKRQLEQILDVIIGRNVEIIGAEQRIADVGSGIAGTVDLLVRDSDGDVYIIDYKTKFVHETEGSEWFVEGDNTYHYEKANHLYFMTDSQGLTSTIAQSEYNRARSNAKSLYKPLKRKPYNPWKRYSHMWNSHDPKSVNSLQHNFQQSMYQTIMMKNGLNVRGKYILPLEVTMTEDSKVPGQYMIGKIEVTKSVTTNKKGLYELKQNDMVVNDVNLALGLPGISRTDYEVKAIQRMQELVNNGLQILSRRVAKLEAFKKSAWKLQEGINLIDRTNEASTMLGIVSAAANELEVIYKQYAKKLEAEKAGENVNWNLTELKSWYDFANSFKILDDIQVFVNENAELFRDVLTDVYNIGSFISAIDSAVRMRKQIESLYESKGKQAFINGIKDYVTFTENNHRLELEREYRLAFHKNPDNKGKKVDTDTLNAYIAEEMQRYKESRRYEEEKLMHIESLMRETHNDISTATAWVSSIFQTSDTLIGAVLKKYDEAMFDARREYVTMYQNLMELVKEYEKKYGQGTFKDQRQLWDRYIDDTGEGFFLVGSLPQSYIQARDKYIKEVDEDKSTTNAEKTQLKAKWFENNAPMTAGEVQAKEKAILDMYESAYESEEISKEMYDLLVEGRTRGRYPKSPNRVAFEHKDRVDANVANSIQLRIIAIEEQYRRPNPKKYPNAKYDALMALPHDSIERRLYGFFNMLYMNEVNVVPPRYMLKYRLPSMSKTLAERAVAGENIFSAAVGEIKEKIWEVRPEDAGFGQYELSSETNEKVHTVPILFVGKVKEGQQSFDLPTILKEWHKSVLNYRETIKVLPELEYTQHILKNRKVVEQRNGQGVRNSLDRRWNKKNDLQQITEDYLKSEENNLATQFSKWMTMVVYGEKYRGNANYDKLVRTLNTFTSLRVMAVNLYATVSNVAVGEINQAIEVAALKLMNKTEYTKGKALVLKDLPNVMGDIGNRVPTAFTNLLLDRFSLEEEIGHGSVKDKNVIKRTANMSALYFGMRMGEFMLRSSFLYGALMHERIVDEAGVDHGSLLENLSVVSGRLEMTKVAELAFTKKHEAAFRRKLQLTMMEMHGNYTPMMQTALQSNAYASMLEVFRKWMVPGIERRWRGHNYSEYSEEHRVGFLNAFLWGKNSHLGRNIKYRYNQIARNFFGKIIEEATMLDMYAKSRKDALPEYEQQAIVRAKTELLTITALSILAAVLNNLEDDDDDLRKNFWFNQLAYQVERARIETMFYINPGDMVTIVKSPVAGASSIADSIGILSSTLNIMDLGDVYESGPYKGNNKYMTRVMKNLPLVRQVMRAMHPSEQRKSLILF